MSEADLFVISAPSGVGKTTLIRRLLDRVPRLEFSVSFTTRARRQGEREGIDYHFVDEAEFDRMLRAGELLEWADVHGNRYGTSARFVDEGLARGNDVLLDVDVQGASSVRRRRAAVTIFIMPPDFETLQRRLRGRDRDSREEIDLRLRDAREEVERYVEYDYVVINESLEEALAALERIVLSRRSTRRRMEAECRRIVETFREG